MENSNWRNNPHKGNMKRDAVFSVRVPQQLRDQLQELANEDERSLADYVYRLIRDNIPVKAS